MRSSFHLLIEFNNDLNESAETLAAIVRAERVRRTRIEDQIRPILATFQTNL